jgi:hypothetical protein
MTKPKTYRPKYGEVQAMQFVDLDSYLEIVAWWKEANTSTLSAEEMFGYRTPIMLMNSRSGATTALNPGDWVIRDEAGEFEKCERGAFEAAYVEAGAA